MIWKLFDEQTKGTHSRKMFAQIWQSAFMMFNLEKKKSVKQEEKGPTKRFSYDLRGRKRLDQEIEKEISFLTSRGILKRAQKKEGHQLFFALGCKESGCGLGLSCTQWEKQGLFANSSLISSLQEKQVLPTNEKKVFSTRYFSACLSLRVKWNTFFFWYSTNFSKTFLCVVPKSILIFFFLFGSLESTLFGL